MRLEDEANFLQAQPAEIGPKPATVVNKLTVEHDTPFAWLHDAADAVEQGRFSRPARAKETNDLTGIKDIDAQIAHCIDAGGASPKMFGKVLDLYKRVWLFARVVHFLIPLAPPWC